MANDDRLLAIFATIFILFSSILVFSLIERGGNWKIINHDVLISLKSISAFLL